MSNYDPPLRAIDAATTAFTQMAISARDAASTFERLDAVLMADPKIRAYIRRRDRYYRRYARNGRRGKR